MNFKDVSELKDFLLWAKKNQIEEVSADGVSVRFSQLAFVPGLAESDFSPQDSEQLDPLQEAAYKANSKTWTDVEQAPEDDEELLYWSATRN